ncbi:MAG: septation protein SepH [Nocardioidaceae bacterium]
MRELRLVGLSADGRQLVLVDDTGAEFATPADDRLRAALRGDRPRLGQLEIEMDSALRPRDIQARIRAGDSPEEVALQAQVPVDQIMPYCVPVLAERQHIAELARRSHVRRRGAEGPSRALADVVAERLTARGIDPRSAEWEAWRRQDGRWAVQASYLSGERQRQALFAFDAVGRYSLADDDEARWLTGERQSTSKGPQPRESGRGGDRRLASVPADDGLLALSEEDADERGADEEETDDLEAVVRAVRETDASDVEPTGAAEQTDAGGQTDGRDQTDERNVAEPPTGSPNTGTEPTPERRRRPKRASVPSWDEIMFGKDDG